MLLTCRAFFAGLLTLHSGTTWFSSQLESLELTLSQLLKVSKDLQTFGCLLAHFLFLHMLNTEDITSGCGGFGVV